MVSRPCCRDSAIRDPVYREIVKNQNNILKESCTILLIQVCSWHLPLSSLKNLKKVQNDKVVTLTVHNDHLGFGERMPNPPMKGLSGSGITTVPSSC